MSSADLQHCPHCDADSPAGSLVCLQCRQRLPVARKHTPVWLLVLLSVIIALLAVYAVLLAHQVFIEHRY